MGVETLPYYKEVKKIMADSSPRPYRYLIDAELYIPNLDKKIKGFKLLDLAVSRDYVNNVSDLIMTSVTFGMGTFLKVVYPNRDLLEMTLTIRQVSSIPGEVAKFKPLAIKYRAILNANTEGLPKENLIHINEEQLNLRQIYTAEFQLVDRKMEALRLKTLQGVFSKATSKSLLANVLITEANQVTVDGKPVIESLSLIEPHNNALNPTIVIPAATPLTQLPKRLQNEHGGVYRSGLGSYIQKYKDKMTWFIYPLYEASKNTKGAEKLVIYYVPKRQLPSIERTYRLDNKVVYVITTSDKQISEDSDSKTLSEGGGFRMVDSRQLLKPSLRVSKDGPISARNNLVHEVTLGEREDQLNFSRQGVSVGSNPFKQYTDLAFKQIRRFDVVWEHGNLNYLYPGMPVTFYTVNQDKQEEYHGTLLMANGLYHGTNKGMATESYLTNIKLVIGLNRKMV